MRWDLCLCVPGPFAEVRLEDWRHHSGTGGQSTCQHAPAHFVLLTANGFVLYDRLVSIFTSFLAVVYNLDGVPLVALKIVMVCHRLHCDIGCTESMSVISLFFV